jgi:hypothetical protein
MNFSYDIINDSTENNSLDILYVYCFWIIGSIFGMMFAHFILYYLENN